MIFVTVGTHEQPFDRLVKAVDDLKMNGTIQDDVFIQTGFGTYVPKACQWNNMLSFDEMQEKMSTAQIVITHGGPASFMMPLQMGKVPIVVPRQARFGEHVNDHQIDFVRQLSERTQRILPVYEIGTLGKVISDFDKIGSDGVDKVRSHNERFNRELEKMQWIMYRFVLKILGRFYRSEP